MFRFVVMISPVSCFFLAAGSTPAANRRRAW